MGFLDPPPLLSQHVFSTKNKQKLAFSDLPPTSADVIYEWSPGEARSLLEHLRDLPVLLRHLVSFIWSGEGITWLFRLRIFILGAMAGVYLLSPFDIVPEAVFGLIGILDDIIVLALFALYAGILYRNFVVDNGN